MEMVRFTKTEEIIEEVNQLFGSEKAKLLSLIPNVNIEHIGSTSVPGTISKGDLDINIRVRPKDFEKAVKILKTLYEVNQPNNWSDAFASFKDTSRNLGIQLTVVDSSDDFFVAQREYLKSNPGKIKEFNALKEEYQDKNMDDYRRAKEEFFEKLNDEIKN